MLILHDLDQTSQAIPSYGALTFTVQVFHIQVAWDVFSRTTMHIYMYCSLPDQLLLRPWSKNEIVLDEGFNGVV